MNRPVRIFLKLVLLLLLIASSEIGFGTASFSSLPIETPIVADFTICAPSYQHLRASGSTGLYAWYTASSGGLLVPNPERVYIARNTTFYVAAMQWTGDHYTESTRVPLNINITGAPTAPLADTLGICGASRNYMYASGAGSSDRYKWYADSTTTVPLKISANNQDSYFYAYIDSSTSYYVSIVNLSGCESIRMRIPIVLKSIPSSPVILSEPVLCGNGTARLEVLQEEGYTYLWYPCERGCANYVNRGGTGALFNENYFDTYLDNTAGFTQATVWVEKISLTTFCPSIRVPLTATSYKTEAPAVPHEFYQCINSSQTVHASLPLSAGSHAVIRWYRDEEKTQLIGQGTNFTIPSVVAERTSVYAVVQDSVMHKCESEVLEGEVIIHPRTTLPPSPIVSIDEDCGRVVFKVQSPDSSMKYFWYTNDTVHTIYSGIQLVNYSESEYASEAFYVASSTEEGCYSKMVRVQGHPKEIAAAPQAADQERCGYGSVNFKVAGAGKNTRYRWYHANGSPVMGEYTAEYTSPYLFSSNSYSVSYLADNGCESEKKTVRAMLKQGVSMTVSSDFVCRGESVALYGAGGNMYRWSENNIIISNWSTIYVNPVATATYVLTDPTIAGECGSVSVTILVNKSSECAPLALEGNESSLPAQEPAALQSKVYPNPFVEEFMLDWTQQEDEGRIFDLTGVELVHFRFSATDKKSIRPILKPGQYILEIKNQEEVYRERIIKL